ncbi:MAG: hypothetical protein ACK5O2_00870 [Microthrixaceae bacterium]
MPNSRRPRRRARPFWTLQRRRYLYSVAIAAVPLASAYGLITDDLVPPVIALAGAVLATGGTALGHPTPDQV